MSKRVITFHYTLTDNQGEVIDSSEGSQPLSYLEGAGQIIPGLESALSAMKGGEKKTVKVPAADAYGERDDALIFRVQRNQLPEGEIHVGDQFRGAEQNSPTFTVTQVTNSEVMLDGNHPLAGQDLNFAVEVTDVRDATADEVQHGHAHGADGHHHH